MVCICLLHPLRPKSPAAPRFHKNLKRPTTKRTKMKRVQESDRGVCVCGSPLPPRVAHRHPGKSCGSPECIIRTRGLSVGKNPPRPRRVEGTLKRKCKSRLYGAKPLTYQEISKLPAPKEAQGWEEMERNLRAQECQSQRLAGASERARSMGVPQEGPFGQLKRS